MLWHISEHLGISEEHAHHTIMQLLGYWKVSAVWVLNEEFKQRTEGNSHGYLLGISSVV
jgi:hypothetical protein